MRGLEVKVVPELPSTCDMLMSHKALKPLTLTPRMIRAPTTRPTTTWLRKIHSRPRAVFLLSVSHVLSSKICQGVFNRFPFLFCFIFLSVSLSLSLPLPLPLYRYIYIYIYTHTRIFSRVCLVWLSQIAG